MVMHDQSEVSSRVGMSILVISGLLVLGYYLLLAIQWVRKMQVTWKEVDKFPGPPKHWLYGNLHQHPGANEEGLQWQVDLVTKHPRVFRMWYGPLVAVVMTVHPETVKKILQTSEPKYTSTWAGAYDSLVPWLGNSLLVGSGPRWFRTRKLLTPAFHFDVLKPYLKIYNKAADILMKKFQAGDSSMEITGPVSLCTLDVMLKCAFSSDMDVQKHGHSHPYVTAVAELGRITLARVFNPFLPLIPQFVLDLTLDGRKYKKCLKLVHGLSEEVIAKRKQVLENNQEAVKKKHPDFVDILLLARDETGQGLTDREIRNEVDTFLFAGHDTTASATSWILYELARNPDHQQRCYEEISAILADKPTWDIDWDDLPRMPHFTLCMKETLRLHSPVPFIGRQLSKPLEFDGVVLKEGTFVDVFPYLIHHNPDIWGPDHMEFKPERFHMERQSEMDPFAFTPFSAGPRNCIGQNFAMNEMKVVIPKIIHRFSLSVDPSIKVEHVPELTMKAKNGIKLFVKERI